MSPIRKVHDFLTVGAPAPLQQAGITALGLPESYYQDLAAAYTRRRELFLAATAGTLLEMQPPQGAYYAIADVHTLRSRLGCADDTELSRRLVLDAGVAAVPGSSFFATSQAGTDLIRFAFAKRQETLAEAGRRLRKFLERV